MKDPGRLFFLFSRKYDAHGVFMLFLCFEYEMFSAAPAVEMEVVGGGEGREGRVDGAGGEPSRQGVHHCEEMKEEEPRR